MNLHRYMLDTRDYGSFAILRPVPGITGPWGELSPLVDTAWADLIPVVTGEAYSHALHGFAKPLMAMLGPPPAALLRMVPEDLKLCILRDHCVSHRSDRCFPCGKTPDCWRSEGTVDDLRRTAATIVVLAWTENRYVMIVEGDEFVV